MAHRCVQERPAMPPPLAVNRIGDADLATGDRGIRKGARPTRSVLLHPWRLGESRSQATAIRSSSDKRLGSVVWWAIAVFAAALGFGGAPDTGWSIPTGAMLCRRLVLRALSAPPFAPRQGWTWCGTGFVLPSPAASVGAAACSDRLSNLDQGFIRACDSCC